MNPGTLLDSLAFGSKKVTRVDFRQVFLFFSTLRQQVQLQKPHRPVRSVPLLEGLLEDAGSSGGPFKRWHRIEARDASDVVRVEVEGLGYVLEWVATLAL